LSARHGNLAEPPLILGALLLMAFEMCPAAIYTKKTIAKTTIMRNKSFIASEGGKEIMGILVIDFLAIRVQMDFRKIRSYTVNRMNN